MSNPNNANINDMINALSNHLGKSPDSIKEHINKGDINEIAKNLRQSDIEKVNSILKNPEMAKEILSSPMAQNLLNQFKD